MELSPSDRQLEMLRIFGSLISDREEWGGELVLTFGKHGYLAPVPVSIAGGCTLLIDDDAAAVKAAMRRGELDFVVNSLDEALRTLKNQVRQKKPLGVGLIGDVPHTLGQMLERGVQPAQILRGGVNQPYGPIDESLDRFRAAGAHWFYLSPGDDERWQRSRVVLRRKRYYAWHVRPHTIAGLRAADHLLLSQLSADDTPRRHWLQLISKYVRDAVDVGRWVWLSEEEFDALPDTLPISPEERP